MTGEYDDGDNADVDVDDSDNAVDSNDEIMHTALNNN